MKKFEAQSISIIPKKVKLSGSADLGGDDANAIVEKALGVQPDFAMLFTYLFRRFGVPVIPCDDYKEMCCYILTSPMENIYLSVHPAASNFNFGLVYPNGTLQKVIWGNYAEVEKWYSRMQKWAKQEHNVNVFGDALTRLSIFSKPDKNGNCRMTKKNKKMFLAEINKWLYISHPEWAGEGVDVPKDKIENVKQEFFEYKNNEIGKYAALYKKIEKKPSMQSEAGKKLHNDIVKAIRATAKDLLRPTYVRDVRFNILHNESDRNGSLITGKMDMKSTVDYFDYSEQAQILRDSIKAK